MASSTGARLKLAVPSVSPAGIVSVKPGTAAKSSAAAVPADTVTDTSVSDVLGAASSVAVTSTAVAPASSSTVPGRTDSATALDAASSSSTVTATSATVTAS